MSHESAFPAPYEAPSSGAGEDREVDVCVCGVLPRLHLPKKEGEKRGRRIEGRELVLVHPVYPEHIIQIRFLSILKLYFCQITSG